MAEGIIVAVSKFPSEEHVDKFCRPGRGEKTCCYLTMAKGGWDCAKATALKQTIDARVVEGTMNSKGDNCQGLLGLILKRWQELKGARVRYEESMPSIQEEGTLQEIGVRDGILQMNVSWRGQTEEFSPTINTDCLDISVVDNSIVFDVAGLPGSFAGKTTIFLG